MVNLKRIAPLCVTDTLVSLFACGLMLWGADMAIKKAAQDRREQTDREFQLAFGISNSDITSENKVANCQLIWAELEPLEQDVGNRQTEYDLAWQFESENGSEPDVDYHKRLDASRKRLSAAKKLALQYNCYPTSTYR